MKGESVSDHPLRGCSTTPHQPTTGDLRLSNNSRRPDDDHSRQSDPAALTRNCGFAVKLPPLVHAILGVRPPEKECCCGADSEDHMDHVTS